MLKKGYHGFLTYVVDKKHGEQVLKSILVVYEYLAVFPKELLRLPLAWEVEFVSEVESNTAPISKAPYHMALVELKEVKV